MSVLIETSFGDITIDLWTQKCPQTTLNFIKLCKIKHYNNSLFIQVQKNHIAKVLPENPTTIWQTTGIKSKKYFQDEIDHELKFNEMGYIATANLGPNLNNSTFFITLTKADLTSLKGKHTIFGRVQQGFDVLRKINDSYCDKQNRPQMNIRILHTYILSDPFEDLSSMIIPASPILAKDSNRLEAVEHLEMLEKYQKEQDIQENIKRQKAKKQAVTLEMLGDLPDANVKPPENVLFVCKLNPITQERDLEIIFSRFGPIKSVQLVRDWKTGQSLQYGFIEFENSTACEEAYLKMNNVLIDDRRIQVDFSQSVSKLMPKSRKPNQAPQRIVKEQQINQKKQKIVMANRKRGDQDNKYSLITSKPNYSQRIQRETKYEQRNYEQFQDRKQKKKQKKNCEQEQVFSDESSSHKNRREKSKNKKKQKKQHKKQKKRKRSNSKQSRERSRQKKHKKQKTSKKQKKQHKKRNHSNSD